MVKLFVSGFPLNMDELELARLFVPHGDLKTIKLVRDKKTRICKGYGFIEMGDRQSAENAVAALHGQEMGDRFLTVNIKEEEEESVKEAPVFRKPSPAAPRFHAPEKKKRPRLPGRG